MSDDKKPRDSFLNSNAVTPTRDAGAQALRAAIVDAARALRAARDGNAAPSAELAAMFERCEALLQSARDAERAGLRLLAGDCVRQMERELVAAMDERGRRAAFAAYRTENEALAQALAGRDDGAPSVTAVQVLMREVHAARQRRRQRVELARRQIAALTALLIGAIVFFTGWALAGGFEWILHEEVEVTLAMMLVNGVLFGFLGGLLSTVFSLLRQDAADRAAELRGWQATIARPFIGAAAAIPIAFFLQSGLINLGNVTPAIDLALCFLGGFSERWFSAQFRR